MTLMAGVKALREVKALTLSSLCCFETVGLDRVVIRHLKCFDTVGWVIWSVRTHPRYDLYVFSGTLNPTQSINRSSDLWKTGSLIAKDSVWEIWPICSHFKKKPVKLTWCMCMFVLCRLVWTCISFDLLYTLFTYFSAISGIFSDITVQNLWSTLLCVCFRLSWHCWWWTMNPVKHILMRLVRNEGKTSGKRKGKQKNLNLEKMMLL